MVRQAQMGDLEFLVENNRRLALETESKSLDRETLRQGVKRGLTQPEGCQYFVAETDGKPTGQTMVTFEWSDWCNGWIWWLQSVYVLVGHRNQGNFRALYQYIKSTAHESRNVRAIRLYVQENNLSGISVYKKSGMSSSGYRVYEEEW